MPPKPKATTVPKQKKKKSDGGPVDPEGGPVVLDLQMAVAKLRLQIADEEKQFNSFLAEKEKMAACWEGSKQELDVLKTRLKVKELEAEDEEDLSTAELKEERMQHRRIETESLRQVLREYSAAVDHVHEQIKATGDDKFRIAQELRDSQQALREFQKKRHQAILALKIDQDKKVTELRLEFDRLGRDAEALNAQEMTRIRQEMDEARKQELDAIEKAKNFQVEEAMQSKTNELLDIKKYFSDITSGNLEILKRLKEEHQILKERQQSEARLNKNIEAKNKSLQEPLKFAQNEIEGIKRQIANFDEIAQRLSTSLEAFNEKDSLLKALSFQQEVLTQQLEIANRDRDKATAGFRTAVLNLQQRTSLKNIVLEKKMVLLQSLEGTEDENRSQELRLQIDQMKNARAKLIREFEQRIAKIHLHIDDLGFDIDADIID